MIHRGRQLLPFLLLRWLRSSLLAMILLSAGRKIYCQQPGSVFDHITTLNGLSSNGVTDVLRDRDGFYWIATHNGLNRFDGTNFKIFHNDPADSTSLVHNHCNALIEDNEGNIWIATMKGISCFQKKQNRFYNHTFRDERIEPDNLNRVFELLKDENGNIWAFGKMLVKYDTRNKKWIDYSRQPPFNSTANLNAEKQATYDAQQKGIWIATYRGIFLLIPATGEIYHADHNPMKWKIFTASTFGLPQTDTKGRLWFHDMEKKTISIFSPSDNTVSSVVMVTRGISKIRTDEKNRLWIFYWRGPSAVYDHETKRLDSSLFVGSYPGSIINRNGSNLYIDPDKNYWISSGYGLSILNTGQQYFKYFRLNEKTGTTNTGDLEILGAANDRNNNVWLATNLGIYKYSLLDNNYRRLTHPLLTNPVFSIFLQGDSLLWISVSQKIVRYNTLTEKIESSFQAKSKCNYFRQDERQQIWAKMWDDGLYCFDPSGRLIEHQEPDSNAVSSLKIRSLVAFEPGRQPGIFWIGYNNGQGFSRFDSKLKTFEHYRIQLPSSNERVSNTITSIFEEAGGNLFLGTYGGGLYYFDRPRGHFTNYLQSDGLHSNFINAIFDDKENNLWISTSAGLNYFNKKEKQIIRLPIDMALISDDFLPNGYKTKEGQFFFFSQNNMVAVDPDKFIADSKQQLQLLVSSIKIFDDEIPFSKSNPRLSLSHRQNFFSFEFSILKTNPSLPVQYAYQLKGFDKGWNHVFNRNTVNYTNVPPGKYIFKVKAAVQNGVWSPEETVAFKILAPWWQQVWFYVLCALFIGAVLYSIYRFRIAQLRKLYLVRSNISQNLHDDIGASLSSIHIFGDLAASVWDTQPRKSKEMMKKISLQSKELMERMNDIVWSLKPAANEQNSLSIKLKNFSHNFLAVKGIKTLYNIDEKLVAAIESPVVRTNLLLIAKEAMNNLAKYSGANEAIITVHKENGGVIVEIEDNGKGFDKNNVTAGNGLVNIEQRCRQLKGSCIVVTAPGQGVKIRCRFPIAIISQTD